MGQVKTGQCCSLPEDEGLNKQRKKNTLFLLAIAVFATIALALELNIHPWILAGPVGIATSVAFIMVTSSPTNIIPYSSASVFLTLPRQVC